MQLFLPFWFYFPHPVCSAFEISRRNKKRCSHTRSFFVPALRSRRVGWFRSLCHHGSLSRPPGQPQPQPFPQPEQQQPRHLRHAHVARRRGPRHYRQQGKTVIRVWSLGTFNLRLKPGDRWRGWICWDGVRARNSRPPCSCRTFSTHTDTLMCIEDSVRSWICRLYIGSDPEDYFISASTAEPLCKRRIGHLISLTAVSANWRQKLPQRYWCVHASHMIHDDIVSVPL